MKTLRVVYHASALIIGLLFGFFLVANSLFSDVFGLAERIQVTVIVLVSYAVLGWMFGYLSPEKGWRWAYWLCGFGFFFLLYFAVAAIRESAYWCFIFMLLYGAGFFAVTAFTAGLGAKLRMGRVKTHP